MNSGLAGRKSGFHLVASAIHGVRTGRLPVLGIALHPGSSGARPSAGLGAPSAGASGADQDPTSASARPHGFQAAAARRHLKAQQGPTRLATGDDASGAGAPVAGDTQPVRLPTTPSQSVLRGTPDPAASAPPVPYVSPMAVAPVGGARSVHLHLTPSLSLILAGLPAPDQGAAAGG